MEVIVMNTLTSSIVSQTILNTFGLLKDIVNYNLNEINSTLESIDIQNTLKIANAILKELENTDFKHNCSIQVILVVIHETIDRINKTIQELNDLVNNHCQKYFYSWRSISYLDHIRKLKDYNFLLNERMKLLPLKDLHNLRKHNSNF